MRTAVIILILAVGIIFLASCQKKIEKTATFTGQVTEPDTSIVLAGVKIVDAGSGGGSTVTDSSGMFKLTGISFDKHNIYFEKEGYVTDTVAFQYTGDFKEPVVSRRIIMHKIGEMPADTTRRYR